MKGTLGLLAFAEVADIATTWFASTHGAREGNPVFLAAIASGSIGAFVLAKLGLIPVAGTLIAATPDAKRRMRLEAIVRFGATMLLGVAASNVLVAL